MGGCHAGVKDSIRRRPDEAGNGKANAALAPTGPKNVRWQIAVPEMAMRQRNLFASLIFST